MYKSTVRKLIFIQAEYHILQQDASVTDEGLIHTWDDFVTTHAAMTSLSMSLEDFFEALLAKYLMANDVPEDKKNNYMALLAFQGDPRNVGLINDDKNRFEKMTTDSGN